MNFYVLTIFPELFSPFKEYGVVGKAIRKGLLNTETINIRDFTDDKHKTTDDRPYGGGCGMVFKPEPLAKAIRHAKGQSPSAKTILLSPQGRRFNNTIAREYAGCESLVLVCGRYEGVDERICQLYIDEELSIGDYILSGGEIAAMVVIDAVARWVDGILGKSESVKNESFADGLLEHSHYTRPRQFERIDVPDVLLSGDHEKIRRWRMKSSILKTLLKRTDLLEAKRLSAIEINILRELCRDIENIIRDQGLCGVDPSSRDQ